MIPLAELKAHLRVTHNADDAYIADLEAAAVDVVQDRAGYYLGEGDAAHTVFLAGNGRPILHLNDAPVLSDPVVAADVTITERAYPGAVGIALVLEEDFAVRDRQLVRLDGMVWIRGYEYEIAFTRGLGVGMAPEKFQQAVRFLVAHWYTNRVPVTGGNRTTLAIPATLDVVLGRRVRVS